MQRLFLCSMFQNVWKLLKPLKPAMRGKTVTYIPTASKVEKLGWFVNIGKWKLKKLGMLVDELDVSAQPYETIQAALAKNDYIYVTGGNTFFLLQELRRTGADALLTDAINNGKFYIGESAGAIVAAKDIGYSAAMDKKEKAPHLKDYAGLGLIDFYVVPHSGNWEFGKAVEQIVADYANQLNLSVISDKQAIFVEGGNVKLL
ncbi:MAG TPA: peptidase [Clostridiales bacterium]|nr:peptidase [Clostridiales bacterium]